MEPIPRDIELARKKKYGEVVVKVQGGYAVMDAAEYRIWRKQK